MSEQTNNLLNLFSKLLRSPRFMMALRMEFFRNKFRRQKGRTGSQGLLLKLWEQDGLTNAEIAELLDIKPSSVSAQVKQLEESGLIERRADENDGRVSRVFLTEAGRNAQSERKEQFSDMSEEVFAVLTKEEQSQLNDLLQKLVVAYGTSTNEDEEFSRPFHPDFGMGMGFNPHEMHRAMNDIRRAGHAMKREIRQNMRNMTNEERRQLHEAWGMSDFANRGFNSKFKNEKSPQEPKAKPNDNWDDF
ncbi:MAG: MarR family transcriptional regulator [Streptococcaceae bacterium]|jgi:DNA-binding MarR family transcriptional regulator|nr:MarR family transcriptional regulator [Streptococcaceae bacterium]